MKLNSSLVWPDLQSLCSFLQLKTKCKYLTTEHVLAGKLKRKLIIRKTLIKEKRND